MLYKAIIFGFAAVFCLFTVTLPLSFSSSNAALHKKYTCSPKPNYKHTASPIDASSLTDGQYTQGDFTSKRTTVGWKKTGIIEVIIDLERVHSVGSITFSTIRDDYIEYPSHVYSYVGTDTDHFAYIGDIVDNKENISGGYKVNKFHLKNINLSGRYILLEIVPKGNYVFCDEVEVLEGALLSVEPTNKGNLDLQGVRRHAENLKQISTEKAFQLKSLRELKNMMHSDFDSEFHRLQAKIMQSRTLNSLEVIWEDILKARKKMLCSHFPGGKFIVQRVSPWAFLSPIYLDDGKTDNNIKDLPVSIPVNGYGYAAMVITNVSDERSFFRIAPHDSGQQFVKISFFEVPFVKSAKMEYAVDPLMPLKNGLYLMPGESRLTMITVHAKQPGKFQSIIDIVSGGSVVSMQFDMNIYSVTLPQKMTLNTVNWAYLGNTDKIDHKQAVIDLAAHHVNVLVVDPSLLPIVDFENLPDFTALHRYLKLNNKASKVLMYMWFNARLRKDTFMGDQWKENFKKWYKGVIDAAVKSGYSENQIYLYPFDEMSEDEIGHFIEFASWTSKEVPSVKFYATLNNKEALKVLPYLDIAQIADREKLLDNLSATKTELWLYDTKGPAKSLSPYSYYRLMSWKVFAQGFKGAGFWTYTDTGWGNPGSAWDDFDGKYPDYSVIYENQGNDSLIISSRRWEAWRVGVEDFELLAMYAGLKGMSEARKLAKGVIEEPYNIGKADFVRTKILDEIARAGIGISP